MTHDHGTGSNEAIATHAAIAAYGAIRRQKGICTNVAVMAHADARPDDDAVGERNVDVADATNAVSAAVEEILSVTESVAALAEQTSASTQEASASSEEITSSADNLRSMASSLESQISAFRF